MCKEASTVTRGAVGKKAPLENFSSPLEKRVEQNLKLLDIVQIILTPLRKLIAPLGVPSWLVVTSQKETCVEVLLPKKRIFGTNAHSKQGRIQGGVDRPPQNLRK